MSSTVTCWTTADETFLKDVEKHVLMLYLFFFLAAENYGWVRIKGLSCSTSLQWPKGACT